MRIRTSLALALTATITLAGCGPEEKPYEPEKPYEGKKPDLPQPPTLPNKKKKEGDAYTVWGAIHDIHSYVHEKEIMGKEVSIVGYIVKINWAEGCEDEMKRDVGKHCVPKCAVFEAGKKDTPVGCEAPIPTFWIADTKEVQDYTKDAIPVMGWASNWSQIYSLIKDLESDEEATRLDPWTGVDMPTPVPNVGAKVKITGKYGFTATVGTKGASSNPRTGIITWRGMDYLEPAPEPAKLPFMD
jgi:hypothetical protein